MLEFIEAHNLTGIIIGLVTFLIIGIFHPLVIKGEYWSIGELFQQRKRVEKGWFPKRKM
jgi:hypothetical protein